MQQLVLVECNGYYGCPLDFLGAGWLGLYSEVHKLHFTPLFSKWILSVVHHIARKRCDPKHCTVKSPLLTLHMSNSYGAGPDHLRIHCFNFVLLIMD